MKVLKIIGGSLAALFALFHLLGLAAVLFGRGFDLENAYEMGQLGGRVFGVCLGAAVAYACFRRKPSP